MSRSLSFYSIPVYYILAMVPHVYSVTLLRLNKQKWDNASPRSEKFAASLKKGIAPDVLGKFERARAAHTNMLSENMAFFIGAVLAGNMAGLNASFMNSITGWYLFSRVAYLVCYIYIKRQPYAWLRTIAFNAGCGMLFWVYFKAGGAISLEVMT